MEMFAFFVVRGWTIEALIKLKPIERLFLYYAMEKYIKDENAKWGGE